jgi:aspartate racemase
MKKLGIVGGVAWPSTIAYYRAMPTEYRSPSAVGAELVIIASNTPHNRFDSITAGIGIPVLNIFDAVAKHCQALGLEEMLILGTAPTMDSPIFPEVLRRFGIAGRAPTDPADRAEILEIIGELHADEDNDAAKRIADVVDRCTPDRSRKRAACLACTELPLAFEQIERATEVTIDSVLYVNTTLVHAKAAFRELLDR